MKRGRIDMPNKNRHGQDVTESGHVIPEKEKIAAAVREILEGSDALMGDTYVKLLANYVMQYSKDDWYNGYRQGLAKGREEAAPMFLAAFEAELAKYPVTDHIGEQLWSDSVIRDTARRATKLVMEGAENERS
jgi:hypothetical protein